MNVLAGERSDLQPSETRTESNRGTVPVTDLYAVLTSLVGRRMRQGLRDLLGKLIPIVHEFTLTCLQPDS